MIRTLRFAVLILPILFITRLGWASEELDLARQLHREGKLREALNAYAAAVTAIGTSDPASSAAAHNNACLIRLGFSEYPEALDECTESVRLRRRLDDDQRLARGLNNLGIIQQNLGDYTAARSAFDEALTINRARDDLEPSVINLSNLGTLDSIEGRYAQALDHHGQAAQIATDHAAEDWSKARLRIALINQGVVFEKVSAYEEALESLQAAQAVEAPQEPREKAQLLVNLGVIYRNLGDPVTAIELFHQAREIFESLGDRIGVAQTEINRGHAYHLNLDRSDLAGEAYRDAYRLAAAVGDRPLEIETTLYLGRLQQSEGSLAAAKARYEEALELSQQSGSSEGRWTSLAGLGDVAVLENDPQLALELYQSAVDEIDRVRAEFQQSNLRADYFLDKREVFARAIQVVADQALQSSDPTLVERSLDLVQRAKSRSLIDALGPGKTPLRPLRTAEVVAAIGRIMLLEYFVTEHQVLLWAIDKTGSRIFDLGDRESIVGQIESVVDGLSSQDAVSNESLANLAERLLPSELTEFFGRSHLYIAPDGALRRLPFEVLPVSRSQRAKLIESTAVSYLPSASVLAQSTPTTHHDLEVAGFANPTLLDSTTAPTPTRDRLIDRFRLQSLPGSDAELDSLDRWLPDPKRLLSGTEATEQSYRAAMSENPRIVHIASHTIIDNRHGFGTAIVLSADDTDDGLLFPREIAQLEGSVGLTVLAACRSAVSHRPDRSALDTLTGALMAGGSETVLATLWDVDDQVTAVFMDQFYNRIGRGITPAEALRQTKLAMIADPAWSDPSIWSAYIVSGALVDPSAARRGSGRLIAAIGVVLIVAGVFFWVRVRNRRD